MLDETRVECYTAYQSERHACDSCGQAGVHLWTFELTSPDTVSADQTEYRLCDGCAWSAVQERIYVLSMHRAARVAQSRR